MRDHDDLNERKPVSSHRRRRAEQANVYSMLRPAPLTRIQPQRRAANRIEVWSEAQPALPLMLVLEPTLNEWPWPDALKAAASTLQAYPPSIQADDVSVLATLAFAVERQHVQSVVVCAEGAGLPSDDPAAPCARLRNTLSDILASLGSFRRAPCVELLWLDTSTGQLHTPRVSGRPHPSLPLLCLVRALQRASRR